MTALVHATGLVKVFRSRSLLRGVTVTRALDGVDIHIDTGEVVALIGESGSGKTTLGKVLMRLTTLDEGKILFEGDDLFGLNRKALRARRRSFQMVFQNQRANLHPKMTVRQMIDESLRLHRPELDSSGREQQVQSLLERVSLEARGDQRPNSLSGGERRRVGLARILATRPKLIVADEPTSGLDAAIKLQIIALLKALKDDQLTYLLISHDLSLVRRIADRVVVMLKGRVIEEVSASQLGSAIHHPYTARLLRAANLKDGQTKGGGETTPSENLTSIGCVYAAECPRAIELGILDRCRSERPEIVEQALGHRLACFGAKALGKEEK